MREMKQRMSIGMNWLVLKFMVMTLIVWLWFKAQFASMAEIWRWEVGTWKAVGRLQSHSLDSDTLGVLLRLTFCACVSPEIVTSQFSLSKEQTMARLVTNSWQKAEAQKRFIWACSWRPFGHQFEPSSRDKTLKIWPFEKDARVKQVLALPQFGSSVTAVGWTRLDHKEKSRVHSIWDGGWS
ncbi:elongator complex protein 2-like isoform X2 [Brassica napus]|uniref:elongator complex protein 2-like isoform X2 n=1 Tax=Brassica napus TaxID=3708 RepID=UPI0006AB5F37|nr:elongator complex protein 2-like isoform X2 [Brassica napus]